VVSGVPAEISEAAYNIAKAWGCRCVPEVTFYEQDPKRNVLRIVARHARNCNYDPSRVFRPDVLDDETIERGAVLAKKRRERANRKYPNKGAT
jgi:hypothetical protein